MFARNKGVFLHALAYYYREGFTYVEVGDGDELMKNRRFSDIRQAHSQVFDQLHKFDRKNRLHLILGNHEIPNGRQERVEKDGLVATEGLVLHNQGTGQQIFVTHGHQADFKCDRFHTAGRFLTRYLVRQLQLTGIGNIPSHAEDSLNRRKVRERIVEWQKVHRPLVICGHTHKPTFPINGGPAYFNTGSCLYLDYITGIEIQDGQIMPVRWTAQSHGPGEPPHFERQLMAQPRQLGRLN
jgi:UDP-2,3-diacylglucosamine pyrophosphatase LpxH